MSVQHLAPFLPKMEIDTGFVGIHEDKIQITHSQWELEPAALLNL